MNELELITAARLKLNHAETAWRHSVFSEYAEDMQQLLDLLIEQLVGTPPGAYGGPSAKFNPERVLEDIATAIKHRTISCTRRWKIIYYGTRITCIPIEIDVPDRIVLHEFTEDMVNKGFSVTYWNHLKQNVIKLYKEFES